MKTQLIMLACMGLCACGSHEPPEHEVMPVKDTVFAPQVQALDKARAVQDTVNSQAAQNDAALQTAEK